MKGEKYLREDPNRYETYEVVVMSEPVWGKYLLGVEELEGLVVAVERLDYAAYVDVVHVKQLRRK